MKDFIFNMKYDISLQYTISYMCKTLCDLWPLASGRETAAIRSVDPPPLTPQI